MFNTILIANRGEIACRIIRSARAMGIKTVAVYSEADYNALHVDMASDALAIGPPPAVESYLSVDAILAAIEESGADAVHPGYGFLSENADFAERLAAEGITFIGPSPDAIRKMGDKIQSKKIAVAAGVTTVPGHTEIITTTAEAKKIAKDIGYPVMLKASAGGGGKGMRLVESAAGIDEGLRACIAEAESSFGDGRVFMEKFIVNPRHIEIQILADQHGNVIHLGERECSIQRRHQKVIEEAPSPFVDDELRARMGAEAVMLAKAVDYSSAGTVEFIVDQERNFYFLEMNTRLQVEHPVTELVTGLDLVEQMIRISDGETLGITQDDIQMNGWAIETRLYAEDPTRGFLPAIGRLIRYREPVSGAFGTNKNVRIDGGANEGDEINRFYDPLIAKLITNGDTRDEAIQHMRLALDEFYVRGVATNLEFLGAVIAHPRFAAGNLSTSFIEDEFGARFLPRETNHEDVGLIAAVAGTLHRLTQDRNFRLQARRLDGFWAGVPAVQENDWVVILNGEHFPLQINLHETGIEVHAGDARYDISTDWTPSQNLFRGHVNGGEVCIQVDKTDKGMTLRQSGFLAEVQILSPRAADMLARMPAKTAADTSKLLISPMPGLLVSLEVAVGDEVKIGEPLAVVEAMKMENQLFAESDGVVSTIHLDPGDNLDVGQLILELK